MIISAAKYYDGVSAVSQQAQAVLYDERLVINSASGTIEWQYKHIQPVDKMRGIFEYETMPDARLIIENTEIASILARSLPKAKINRKGMATALRILILLAIIISMVFFVIPFLSPLMVPYAPLSWDKRLGAYAKHLYVDKFPKCQAEQGTRALNSVMRRLTAPLHSPYEYHIEVVDLPVVNAIALPGGYIVVFAGLIKQSTDPDELVGVLAHEIGHAEKRHGMEMLIRGLSTSFMLDVIAGGSGTALYLGSQLHELQYSRAKEKEADDFALTLMQQQNINPLGFARFFAHIHNEDKKDSAWLEKDAFQFLSSHPGNEERMEAAQKAFKANHSYTPSMSTEEWGFIKNICPTAEQTASDKK